MKVDSSVDSREEFATPGLSLSIPEITEYFGQVGIFHENTSYASGTET